MATNSEEPIAKQEGQAASQVAGASAAIATGEPRKCVCVCARVRVCARLVYHNYLCPG